MAQRDRPVVWGVLGCCGVLALVLVVSPLLLVVAAGSWAGVWEAPGESWIKGATVGLAWLWALALLVALATAAGLFVARRNG